MGTLLEQEYNKLIYFQSVQNAFTRNDNATVTIKTSFHDLVWFDFCFTDLQQF